MMTKKPTLNVEAILSRQRQSESDDFLDAFFFRTIGLFGEMENGRLSKEVIAFESLLSAFSFLDEDLSHEELKSAYPVESWREETITIPKAWVRVLLEGWVKYKNAPTGTTLGEAMGIEGGGQGRQPLRATLDKFNRDMKLSNAVCVEYLAHSASEERISWEKAIERVAEAHGKSRATVKAATTKFKDVKIERMRERGWIQE